LLAAYGASFVPIPGVRQIAAGSINMYVALDIVPKLMALKHFDSIWGPSQESLALGAGSL
jgi:hypothetical protein